MSTTVAAARSSLFGLLRASTALDSVQLEYGAPLKDEKYEVVALLGVFDPTEDEAEIGGIRKAEAYRLEIGVKVFDPEKTAEEVDARGFELADAVRDVVHGRDRNNDRTLNGALAGGFASVASLQTVGVRRVQGGGWVIFIRVMIACQSRIT